MAMRLITISLIALSLSACQSTAPATGTNGYLLGSWKCESIDSGEGQDYRGVYTFTYDFEQSSYASTTNFDISGVYERELSASINATHGGVWTVSDKDVLTFTVSPDSLNFSAGDNSRISQLAAESMGEFITMALDDEDNTLNYYVDKIDENTMTLREVLSFEDDEKTTPKKLDNEPQNCTRS